MERDKKYKGVVTVKAVNPIVKMIEDKKRIAQAIKNGESLSTLKGIKIVSPV
ncbi:hypothetical protein SNE26_03770 [Mucilaginibacter sp. cycad4]|uniref:hypothetical protein n=1 Tax=Mucilaginibacter sp. cycad4 TaxID=3342096 RepID=UPI002AAAE16E|nr:hypothetical protein [Mucilaginibacter gossypii]WPV00882.1 hypothetical protein SNE26_03770 [Mucilaginibacter gossypii]